ncbi:ABC transporter permease [Paenibacillus sp. CAU 1782]
MTGLLFKNTVIKIKKSFGRYFSILMIVMVGVGFFAGIQSSAPSIRDVADQYFNSQQIMDLKIYSTAGLSDNDVEALAGLENVQAVVPSYSLDVLDRDKAIRIHAIETEVNNISLIQGRLPEGDNEAVGDSRVYRVGDEVSIISDVEGKLKQTSFTVVGTSDSALYVSEDYGSSLIGDGKLASYLFVDGDNFLLDAYTEVYLVASKDSDATAYSSTYEGLIASIFDGIISIKGEREEARYEEMKAALPGDIPQEMADEFLVEMPYPSWTVMDREAVVGYNDLGSSIEVIDSVAAVFPFFFVLIAMLMTSNSMARMITEERGELGTLVSLGFSSGSVAATYLFYVLSASGIGATVGFLAGCRFIPPLVYDNFTFVLPSLETRYNWVMFFVILALALVVMTAVTLTACSKALKLRPAALMRPVVQEKGQRILLERIGYLWSRFSFNWKITVRNLFRYKKRGLMTIVGVAGCTALLLVGFGLRDSMNGVVEKQYGEIFRYSDMGILKQETKTIDAQLEQALEWEGIIDPLLIKQTAYKSQTPERSLEVYSIVPEDENLFPDYYSLKSAVDGNEITLGGKGTTSGIKDEGVIVTSKIAAIWNAGIGDTIEIKDRENNVFALQIADIAENYAGHYLFMSKEQHEEIFQKEVEFNAFVSRFAGDQTALAVRLLERGLVLNVSFTDDILGKALDNNKSLNGVIVLIIFVASLLAFIIIYNLTSITISERTREIATLKVLGLYDRETNGYIYREATILTLISIGAGLVLGIFIHSYIVDVISDQSAMILFKKIKWLSFVLAAVLTVIFSTIMQLITYYKLRAINMIESLKSVE